jgi:diguanylate cyclase (GGDEF)-like protein
LTSLLNRAAFDEEMNTVIERAGEGAFEGVLVLIDVDRLAQLNESLGLEVGNKVLRQVARLIRETATGMDVIAARYDGDTFAVILHGGGSATGKNLAETIRQGIEQGVIGHQGERLAVTVSLGVVCLRAEVSSEATVDLALQAVDAAKQAGRNRCYFHDGEAAQPITSDMLRRAADRTNTPGANNRSNSETAVGFDQDRRRYPRLPCDVKHRIAPYYEGTFPAPDAFNDVPFNAVSSGGFSLLLPAPPQWPALVVAVERSDGVVYFQAQLIHCTKSPEPGPSGRQMYLVGCRFAGRIMPPAAHPFETAAV